MISPRGESEGCCLSAPPQFSVFKIYSGENDLNMTGISMQILFGKSHQCYCVNSHDETLQLTKSRHNLLRIFMLLKFLNLGSGFPVKNRLKPFFPFIARQPENTRHQPALLAIISFNLLLTAQRELEIFYVTDD